MPISGADRRAVTMRSSGAETSHAQAMPTSPHCAPMRNDAGKRIAPLIAENIEIDGLPSALVRSEEHTSELQSLMRISYAVFCLKKKKKNTLNNKKHNQY